MQIKTLSILRPWPESVTGIRRAVLLILSIYVLVEASAQTILTLGPGVERLLDRVDLIICLVFLADFAGALYMSQDRWGYVRHHWFDALSAIPFWQACRALRVFTVIRCLRGLRLVALLKSLKAVGPVVGYIRANHIQGTLAGYVGYLLLASFYCSMAFYSVERGINPNVHGYPDAAWWTFCTVTTIGYGDVYPMTHAGRVVAIILSLSGMGFFSLITAAVSARFVAYLGARADGMEHVHADQRDAQLAQVSAAGYHGLEDHEREIVVDLIRAHADRRGRLG